MKYTSFFSQGAKLVSRSIESGDLFTGTTWQKLAENAKSNNGTMHFIGLLSDGNVHSHIDHLKAMIEKAKNVFGTLPEVMPGSENDNGR